MTESALTSISINVVFQSPFTIHSSRDRRVPRVLNTLSQGFFDVHQRGKSFRWFGSSRHGDDGDGGEVKENINVIGGAAINASHGAAPKTKVDPGTNNAPPKPTPDVSGSSGGAGGDAPKGGGKQDKKL